MRAVLAALVAVSLLLPPSTVAVSAASGDRTLYLYYTHTKETGRFTYKRNGQFDRKVLRELNHFLRDWRRNEDASMDPALFDLLWSVYNEVGGKEPIHIVSAYRSPATNAALRAKSSGVAENSQHTKGRAMDFFIPGVSLTRLREVAMKHQVGGVGYYPTSGSPFVHLDTGSVRAWPRMTRAQLKKVFPDGRTLHLPSDGRPLSEEGRRYAEAEWKKCHAVPCNGRSTTTTTMLADAPVPATPGKNLLDFIFGGGEDDEVDAVEVATATAEPTQRQVQTVAVSAPVPMPRPGALPLTEPVVNPFTNGSAPLEGDPLAPVPAQKSQAILLATGPSIPGPEEETALVALANLGAPVPKARVLMTSQPDESVVTAYVPAITPDPGAQRALEMIIERETTSSLPPPAPLEVPPSIADAEIRTASMGADSSGNALQSLMDMTWNAVQGAVQPPVATALAARTAPDADPSFAARSVELVAPDIDHVAEILVQPVAFSSGHFAELYEAEGYLDKTTELGALTTRVGFLPETGDLRYDAFVAGAPLLVATN